MTISNVTAGSIIDPTWGNAVTDEINSRGVKGYATKTSNQSIGAATMTDISGLSVTFTAEAGRLYKLIGKFFATTASAQIVAHLRTSGGTTVGQHVVQSSSAGDTLLPMVLVSPGAGSITYKLSVIMTGAGNVFADATDPAFILVEDIGAA